MCMRVCVCGVSLYVYSIALHMLLLGGCAISGHIYLVEVHISKLHVQMLLELALVKPWVNMKPCVGVSRGPSLQIFWDSNNIHTHTWLTYHLLLTMYVYNSYSPPPISIHIQLIVSTTNQHKLSNRI